MIFDFAQQFYPGFIHQWSMNHSERFAIIQLLSTLQPQCTIEIGCFSGGSTSVFSRYSQKVYSLDIDPTIPERLQSRFDNVEFVIGRSQDTLPDLLRTLKAASVPVGFILVDGDHTADAVYQDCQNILQYIPDTTCCIVCHDSFNPGCRSGIRRANWHSNPHVQYVNLDFIPGVMYQGRERYNYRQMWGGLALAVMTPEKRSGPLEIEAMLDMEVEILKRHSTHFRDLQGLARLIAMMRKARHKFIDGRR